MERFHVQHKHHQNKHQAAVLPEENESHDEEYTAVVVLEKQLKNIIVRSLVVVVIVIHNTTLFAIRIIQRYGSIGMKRRKIHMNPLHFTEEVGAYQPIDFGFVIVLFYF